MALDPVKPGWVAFVVTSLDMRERPKPRPALAPPPFRLERWTQPAADRYRALFRRVGEPWLWFSRLEMTDRALLAIIHDPKVEVYALVDRRGIEVGMLELDFRTDGHCAISYFALIPELTGKGIGRWLMEQTLMLAWRKGIGRVWVHTCTLDHPAALGFYRRHGFVPYSRTIETFPDPRLSGIVPRDAAPHIPLIAPQQPIG